MSYCHNTPYGVNLNLGFGTEPGNLIRQVIASCPDLEGYICQDARVLYQSGSYQAPGPGMGNSATNYPANHANWFLFVAHFCLHSGRHSERDFCSTPLGLVHSYIQVERQASNAGSFFVPLIDGSTSLAHAGVPQAPIAIPPATRERKLDLDIVDDESDGADALLSPTPNP